MKNYLINIYDSIFNISGHLCHQKPERSFFIKNYQFPFCARCTGIIIGVIIAVIFSQVILINNFYLMIILWIPMITDGMVQKHSHYLSNNKKRVITGILFGFGYMYIFIILDRMFW